MLKRMSLLAICFAAVLPVQAAAVSYQVVSVTERRVGPLVITEETVQAGQDPAARFTLHRMTKPNAASRGAMLLMPGGASNFAFYAADDNGKELQSFAAYFALRGIDVWGYSPRTQGLAPGACSGAVDCSGMRDWGMQAVVDDALYIRERIRQVRGADRPVIAGLSLGAMSTLALMNAAPDVWAGAVVWEGMLYSTDPVILSANQVVCDEIEARLAGGEIWDDANYPVIRFLYALATSDPNGPTPLPDFAGLTNRQVFLALLTTPQPAPPAYVPGYTLVVGDLGGFTYSTEDRLGVLIDQLNHYEPLALIRDYTCALAGERIFTGSLESFDEPVYAIGGGQSFGAWMGDNIDLLGSPDVTWNYVPEFGHADHFASPDHRRLLEEPLFQWLKRVLED
jgi:pimeloyl-ACP methyl ester carboxylesterase